MGCRLVRNMVPLDHMGTEHLVMTWWNWQSIYLTSGLWQTDVAASFPDIASKRRRGSLSQGRAGTPGGGSAGGHRSPICTDSEARRFRVGIVSQLTFQGPLPADVTRA